MPQLRLLGRAAVLDDQGRTLPLSSRRHPMALLALLATAPSCTLTRSKLAGLLWPEVPERTARNRLSTSVHEIRTALGEGVLVSAGDGVTLDTEVLPSDVRRFKTALEAGDPNTALAVYEGPFVDGLFLEDAAEFEERTEQERHRLERLRGEALEALAREAEGRQDAAAAARWWRERAHQAPFDSRVALELVQALVRAGNPGEAVRAARRHQERLKEELGLEPDPDFLARVEDLARSPAPAVDAAARAAAPRSLAVLPFQVTGPGADAEHLADGLHQDLLTELARIPHFRIIAGTSVREYRGSTLAASAVAEELGVAHLLQGSLQVLDQRLRLRVQLLDAGADRYLWAESYDRRLTTGDLFEIQSDLAAKIAGTLRLEMGGAAPRPAGPSTDDMEAYRLYARGRAFMSPRSRAAMWRAVECFETALELDPGYALAWAGLADALVLLGDYHFEEAGTVRDRGEAAARRALELDPDLAEAHSALGNFLSWQRRLSDAIPHHRRAGALQPGYAHAHQWLCWTNLLAGRAREARSAGEQAVALDPFEPEAAANLATAVLGTGDPRGALETARRILDHHPDFQYGRLVEGMALWHLGRWEEGRRALEGLTDPWGRAFPPVARILEHAMGGAPTRARELLLREGAGLPAFHRGVVLSALGSADAALEALGAVDRLEWPETLLLRYHPPEFTAAVGGTPAFRAFVTRVDESWGLHS